MSALRPIDTAPLFAPLHDELVTLLRSLTPQDWLRPTLAREWRVRDVAAHLVDGALRKVAVYRDGHRLDPERPITSPADVAGLVHRLNASGVDYARRLSVRQLLDLIDISGRWLTEQVIGLPPHGRAIFPVSWAGEEESENWMDTGREYTERWHHQQQIRDAVGAPLLLEPHWLEPLLDISMRALPVAYREVAAAPGTALTITVLDHRDGRWTLRRETDGWMLERGLAAEADCTIQLAADQIWRLLFNALTAEAARGLLQIEGDVTLAEPLLRARSVIV